MKKAFVFVMALIMLFFFCACSTQASSGKIDVDNNGFNQLPDLDMGQNIYENFDKQEHVKSSFVFDTPFGPININDIPPFLDIPIQWNQKNNLSGDIVIV